MDESPRLAWATPLPAVLALGVGSAVLVGVALLGNSEAGGRLLIGLAGLCAAALAGLAAYQRPRLAIDGDVLVVGTLRGPQRYTRPDIDRIRLRPYARLGRRTPMIEIDATIDGHETLIVFGRWDLGADPRDVFDALSVNGFVPES